MSQTIDHFIKNIDGTVDQDKVFVCDRLLNKIGHIDPVEDLSVNMRFNQNGECSFKIYKQNDGNIHPFWYQIDDIGIILIEGKGYFEISVPESEDNTVYKEVHGVTLGEAETSQTNITITFNDDNDAEWDETIDDPSIEYNNRILYDAENPNHSMLHAIFKNMPHYSIGHVDASVAILQRTFSCENTPIYNFLQTIAEELECVFVFDKFKREVNCYDLKDHCNRQSCIEAKNFRKIKNGVCTCCNTSTYVSYGYGTHTGVNINTNNLAEILTVTGDKDSVKNTFKIVGGDDIITNEIATRLMEGNKITKFSEYQINQMSPELQRALIAHDELVQANQSQYNSLWNEYNECIEKKSYYESSMMPSFQSSNTTAESIFNKASGQVTIAFKTSANQDNESILRSIKTRYSWFVPKEYSLDMTLLSSTSSSINFRVVITLKDAYKKDKSQSDICTREVTLSVKNGYEISVSNDSNGNPLFTTDYYAYLKKELELMLARADITDETIIFDPPVGNGTYSAAAYANYNEETNPENLNHLHYTMYCRNRLNSYKDAYETCSSFIAKLNSSIVSDGNNNTTEVDNNTGKVALHGSILNYITANGGIRNIYDDLLGKYIKYIECLDARITYLNQKIYDYDKRAENALKSIRVIQDLCRLETFIKDNYGEDYWIELCSFIREDVYTNENFFAEGLEQEEINENIELLIEQAKEELESACEIKYSITTTVANLLTIDEFKPFWDNFQLGNWITATIDDYTYNLRLVGIDYDFNDVSHIGLEFSTTTKVKDPIADIKSVLAQASSIATNFSSVARQAEKGSMTNDEFAVMKQYGLDVANMMILNSGVGEYTLNEYGFTGRVWDDNKNAYGDEQIRIINNLLCFTSDAWKHTRLALGKIIYYDDEVGDYRWAYGLNAEVLVANLILSKYMKIYNKSGTYSMTDDGFLMKSLDKKSWIEMLPNDPSISIYKNNNPILLFNTTTKPDTLWLSGTLEAGKVIGGEIIGSILKSKTWGNGNIDNCAATNGTYIDLDNVKWNLVGDGITVLDFNRTIPNGLWLSGTISASTFIGGLIKSQNWGNGNASSTPNSGIYFDLINSQLIMRAGGKELFSFNKDGNEILIADVGLESPKITGGILKSQSWKTDDINLPPSGQAGTFFNLNGSAMTFWDGTKTILNLNSQMGLEAIKGKIGDWSINDGALVGTTNKAIIKWENTDGKSSMTGGNWLLTKPDGEIRFSLSSVGSQTNTPESFLGLAMTGIRNHKYYIDDNLNLDNGLFVNSSWIFMNCTDLIKMYSDLIYFGIYNKNDELSRVHLARTSDDNLQEFSPEKDCRYRLGGIGKNDDGTPNNHRWSDIYANNATIQTSDAKEKYDVKEIEEDLNNKFVNGIKPVSYKRKNGTSKRNHYGMIAQDIEKLLSDLGLTGQDFAGLIKEYDSYGLRYEEFIAPLIKYSQSLYQTNQEQQKEIDDLKTEVDDLKNEIKELKEMIKAVMQ